MAQTKRRDHKRKKREEGNGDQRGRGKVRNFWLAAVGEGRSSELTQDEPSTRESMSKRK